MTILGPDGKPIILVDPTTPPVTRPIPQGFKPSRQMRRAYLRICAMAVINQVAGGEPRRLRRAMARERAKRPAFIEEVRRASGAW